MWLRHLRPPALLLPCLLACSALGACNAAGDDDDDRDPFDPSGMYRGPGSLVGTDGAQPVTTGEDDTVALTDSSVTIGIACGLQLRDGDDIGLEDHTGDDDDVVRYFGKLQLPIAGQTCTLPGAGAAAITLVVSDGLVTTWRAGANGSMDLSLTGTTAAGGSLTYRFSGFR